MTDELTDKSYNIETSLEKIGERIASAEFASHVRRILEMGHDLKYQIKIKHEPNETFSITMENIIETNNRRLSRHYNLI